MKKQSMFENYPDVVEVDDLRKMLGGISKKLAYRLLSDQEIRSVRVGRTYKIPKICVIEYLMGEEMCHINLSLNIFVQEYQCPRKSSSIGNICLGYIKLIPSQ